MGWIKKRKEGAAGSEQMEKQRGVTQSESKRERGMFNALHVPLLLLLSVSQHAKNIRPIPLLTHTQAKDGNYEQCTAGRQHREK